MSGAALFCGNLLTGVMAVDPAGTQHAHLEAVPSYMLLRDPKVREILKDHGGADPVLEPVELQKLADVEPPIGRSPAGLLRARRQVVEFRGRKELLRNLRTWTQGRDSPDGCSTGRADKARPDCHHHPPRTRQRIA